MVKVKVCGITNQEDAEAACNCGADALGFIFYEKSPRFLNPEMAKDICTSLPPFVTKVGVFVNEQIEKIVEISQKISLNLIQLHGDESPEYCNQIARPILKVFRIKDGFEPSILKNYHATGFLLDTYKQENYGGTGETFDWEIARKAKNYGQIVLSGGLNPKNVKQAIEFVQPYAVDVASGVEKSPGKKDRFKLNNFFNEVKKAVA